MEEDIRQKLAEQEKKLDDIYKSVERMRKYFLWTLVVTVGTILLPLIALAFVLPWFVNIITSAYNIQ
jgi:CHASE3 domain sensor protein